MLFESYNDVVVTPVSQLVCLHVTAGCVCLMRCGCPSCLCCLTVIYAEWCRSAAACTHWPLITHSVSRPHRAVNTPYLKKTKEHVLLFGLLRFKLNIQILYLVKVSIPHCENTPLQVKVLHYLKALYGVFKATVGRIEKRVSRRCQILLLL